MAFTINDVRNALQGKAQGVATTSNKLVEATKDTASKTAGFVKGSLPVTTRRFEEEVADAHKRDVINSLVTIDIVQGIKEKLGVEIELDSPEGYNARAEEFLSGQVEAKKIVEKKEEKKPVSLRMRLAALLLEDEELEELVLEEPKEEKKPNSPTKKPEPKKEKVKAEPKKEEVKPEVKKEKGNSEPKKGRRRLGRQKPIEGTVEEE